MINQTQANSTEPNDLKTLLLANIQFNKYTDAFNIYLIVPSASLSTLLNLICFDIFRKKSFDSVPFFKYMRVYTLASFIVSLSLMFCFYFAPFTLPQFLLAYTARVFACKIFPSFVTAFFFFFENALEIFINIDRAVSFSSKFDRFKKISPYLISLILLLVCALINGPVFLLYDIVEDSELPKTLRLCRLSQFSKSYSGKLFLMISFVIQGPVVLVLVIATNVIAMVSYRRYLKRKTQANELQDLAHREIMTEEQKKNEKINKNLLFMTFYLSIFSVVNHSIQFSSQFVIFIFALQPSVSAWFIFTYTLNFVLKNLMNIFFFYNYSNQFKNDLLDRYLIEQIDRTY